MSDTIFMIHGMWANADYGINYRRFFEERGYRCIAPTLRHHGGPPDAPPHPDLGATSLLDYAADLEAELRKLERPPIIVGHSMGGLLAQMLGARGLAKALVLLTPASPRGILAIRLSVLRAFLSGFTKWAFWRKPYRQTFGEATYSMMHLLTPAQQREIYGSGGWESGRAAAEIGFWLLDPRRATAVDERKVTCPVLVVGGEEDRITPAPVVRQVAKKYRQATYREFPRHAHCVLHEPGWEEIAGYCVEWLAEHAPAEESA